MACARLRALPAMRSGNAATAASSRACSPSWPVARPMNAFMTSSSKPSIALSLFTASDSPACADGTSTVTDTAPT
jgi:hypothetical protein